MRIKFLKDFANSDDGHTVVKYRAGEVREVSDFCGNAAIQTKAGEKTDAPETPPIKTSKQLADEKQEKALAGAPKNKAR